jgi:hypothetical protein
MTIQDISLVSSIASLVLAIVAIALSIIFFIMSTSLSNKTTEAANGISSSVAKLEKLFDSLYNDTFSMMKETVTNIQKHAWGDENSNSTKVSEAIEKKLDERLNDLKASVNKELSTILERQNMNEEQINSIKSKVGEYIENAIIETREIENSTISENLSSRIKEFCVKNGGRRSFFARDLVNDLISDFGFRSIGDELRLMRKQGLLVFQGNEITPDSRIILKNKYYDEINKKE